MLFFLSCLSHWPETVFDMPKFSETEGGAHIAVQRAAGQCLPGFSGDRGRLVEGRFQSYPPYSRPGMTLSPPEGLTTATRSSLLQEDVESTNNYCISHALTVLNKLLPPHTERLAHCTCHQFQPLISFAANQQYQSLNSWKNTNCQQIICHTRSFFLLYISWQKV